VSEAFLDSSHPLRRIWRRIAPLIIVNVVYFGVLVYPILRISVLLNGTLPGTPTLLLIMVGPLAGRLAYEAVPNVLTRWLSALALTWLGICFMAFLLVISFELLHWVVVLSPFTWGLIIVSGLVSLTTISFVNAQLLTTKSIPVAAPEALAGLSMAQISDVHVGSRSGRFLARVVARVNAQNPDWVLITGDLIDFRDISTRELRSLAELEAPAYFIIGNHERYVDLQAICDRLTSLGIHVIRNNTVRLDDIQLIGIDDADPKSQVGRVLNTLEPDHDRFRILLYHRPDGAEDAARWGADLMLCGHTHNGQIIPFNFIVRRIFPRIRGLYDVDGMKLYVSPGTGTWGPVLRLGSRCEITLFNLVENDAVADNLSGD